MGHPKELKHDVPDFLEDSYRFEERKTHRNENWMLIQT